MHQLWCAHFARAYESLQNEGAVANWEDRFDLIKQSAYECTSYARDMNVLADKLPQNIALDALRLHHIMAAPDTPPELLAELTRKINEVARKPEEHLYAQFLKFTRTYLVCTYLTKKREWPSIAGNLARVEDTAYKKCLRGVFALPSEEHWGEIWIHEHYPYIKYMDQFVLRAKDATRVPDDVRAAVSVQRHYQSWEHNELLHCIKKGSNLGLPHMMSVDEARDRFWDPNIKPHNLIMTAAKAEATKSDFKPRGTFSATGEFRHPQGEFDRNCQVINDLIGCGSIRADPVNHAKGMARVCRGTALGHTSTSHDIESWSPSQDREAWCAYGEIYAECFKGVDSKGWASSWFCFDSVVNKNSKVYFDHIQNGGFQGFPGTLDTSLHVMILVFFLHRMRLSGRIPRDVPTLAKATIDDCLAQMATWNGSLVDLERELSDHYLRMGYIIDQVKSVISKCKAIYLNQAMIRGAFIHQGTKVMCKTDRPQEIVLRSPMDDAAACYAGAKAAIQVGNCPLVSYFISSMLSCSYLYRAHTRIAVLKPHAFTIAALSPRGDGGLGLPSLADLVSKEHPDARAQANHCIYAYVRGFEQRKGKIDDSALKLWAHLKTQPMCVATKSRIFFNPRSVVREGVPLIESIKRSFVIDAARKWTDAPPFKGILSMANNDAAYSVYSQLLSNAVHGVDCAFLEAYTAHLPESMIDTIVGKVTSYKVASELMGQREVVYAQSMIDSRYRRLIDGMIDVQYPEGFTYDITLDTILSVSGFRRTVDEREAFYALNNVVIINHTIASPFEVIAMSGMRSDNESRAHISSDVASLVHYAPDCPVSSHSMVSRNGVAYPFKAQNWIAESLDEYRNLDMVSHMFVEGCGVVEWAKHHGENMEAWERTYLRRWLGWNEMSTSDFVSQSMQGSIKRSSAAAGTRTHPTFIGQNLQRSVDVNVGPLLALITDAQYDIDPLSLVAASYAIGTTNLVLLIDGLSSVKQPLIDFKWSIGIHPDTLTERLPFVASSSTDLSIIDAVFDLELDELAYCNIGGGTERQLNYISNPGNLRALLRAQVTTDESLMFMAEHASEEDLAPMYSAPVAAPTGAAFIIDSSGPVARGLIVQDKFEDAVRVRTLEVSPHSARTCAAAALQLAAEQIGINALARYFVGDKDAVSREHVIQVAGQVAANTIQFIQSNLAMSFPMLEAGKGIRAMGCSHFDWYDPSRMLDSDFISEFQLWCSLNFDTFLESVRRTVPEYVATSGIDYSQHTKAVRVARDPERQNQIERVKRLKRKFKARSAAYSSRIRMIKHKTPVKQSDDLSKREERYGRVAYLAGACVYMSCVEFVEGPQVDVSKTAHNLLNIINKKISDKEGVIKVHDSDILHNGTFLNEHQLLSANSGLSAPWWKPRHFVNGIMQAQAWANTDCVTEGKEVYYVPRTVRVVTKIRSNILYSLPIQPYRTDIGLVPTSSVQSQTPRITPQVATTAPEAQPAPDDFSLDDELEAMMAAAQESSAQKRTPAKVHDFAAGLEAWQCAVLIMDNDFGVPDGLTYDEGIAVSMIPRKITGAHISSDSLMILRSHVEKSLLNSNTPLVAPDYYEEEKGEVYVM
jgi:hypothetical protein